MASSFGPGLPGSGALTSVEHPQLGGPVHLDQLEGLLLGEALLAQLLAQVPDDRGGTLHDGEVVDDLGLFGRGLDRLPLLGADELALGAHLLASATFSAAAASWTAACRRSCGKQDSSSKASDRISASCAPVLAYSVAQAAARLSCRRRRESSSFTSPTLASSLRTSSRKAVIGSADLRGARRFGLASVCSGVVVSSATASASLLEEGQDVVRSVFEVGVGDVRLEADCLRGLQGPRDLAGEFGSRVVRVGPGPHAVEAGEHPPVPGEPHVRAGDGDRVKAELRQDDRVPLALGDVDLPARAVDGPDVEHAGDVVLDRVVLAVEV